jgi:hypothetical protein
MWSRSTGTDGKQRLAVVSQEAFLDIGASATHDRFRGYVNFPMPLLVTGTSGTIGPYQFTAPSLTLGTNPDTVSDGRIGVDARLLGKPGGLLRLGAGAQLIFPSGDRADYVTDARYRGMFRFLMDGDAGAFRYAGQFGAHLRSLNDAPAPAVQTGASFFMASVGDAALPARAVGRSLWGLKFSQRRLFAPSSVGRQGQRLF